MSSSYIKIDEINHINAELSNYCNASCPMCARFDSDQNLIESVTNKSHTTLDDVKYRIGEKVIKNLKIFGSCGNLGDGTMNPQCFEIFEFVRSLNSKTKLTINTNGGARTPEFFSALAKIGVKVIFSIDGLEDTNHLYRRNVKWQKLISNVQAYISAGGQARWEYLIFKHNQHQVTEAEGLSKKLGFYEFVRKTTERWNDFDSKGNWISRDSLRVDDYYLEKASTEFTTKYANSQGFEIFEKKPEAVKKSTRQIKCLSFTPKNVEIYIDANGNVSPCCWMGDPSIHESKNIIKDYRKVNLRHTSLQEILEGEYFNEIWKGIQGLPQEYKLITCENMCGVCNE